MRSDHRKVLDRSGIHNFTVLESRWSGCQCCDNGEMGPVVRDDIWAMICVHPTELLCISCMGERYGTKITLRMFKRNVPWNASFLEKYGTEKEQELYALM